MIQPGVSITSPEYRHCLLLDLVLDLFLSINKHMPRVLVNTFRTRARHAPVLWPQFEVAAVEPVVQMVRWKRGERSSTCCCSPA